MKEYGKYFNNLEVTEALKRSVESNPIITQNFGADPYAMVYEDTLYIYMTADDIERNADLEIVENTYSKIKSIRVVSTKDMVNFTDHGEIPVAGKNGAATWATNSWAPAAAWKDVDGKVKFFLYFADAGGGIGVLEADSPTGPFTDPLGKGLITRDVPNCGDITWLFDPAVLVDEDNRAYLYFGGGIPSDDKISDPGTARVVELGADMISLKGEPVRIDVPYLFEDSGIHKVEDKYYYTYCSNWQVDEAGTQKYGFTNAEIISMESDSPMGPFVFKERILENPGKYFGLYGNNHHCVFSFGNQWYITYHTRLLEKKMGIEKGYRSTHINAFEMGKDGTIGIIPQSAKGCEQLAYVDAYTWNTASSMALQSGLIMKPSDEVSKTCGAGNMAVGGIDAGDFQMVRGVDFGHQDAQSIGVKVRKAAKEKVLDDTCVIQVRLDSLRGDVIGYIPVKEAKDDWTECTVQLTQKVNGVHNLYLIFGGTGYQFDAWRFQGSGTDWYQTMIEKSLISTGENGRLEQVLKKMDAGEAVKIAFIGGSVTEGAGAKALSESYADQTVAYLKKTYPQSEITYVNAGLGGTPSALGVMRYDRDVVEALGATPDLVFLEFAVNDYEEVTQGRAYESMVRTMLSQENTAVVLVFAVFESKFNMQEMYIPVGTQYGLSMVTVKDAIEYAYQEEKLTTKEYFSDEYHPTSYGHEIMADCITYMIDLAAKKEAGSVKSAEELLNASVIGDSFMDMHFVTAKHVEAARINQGAFSETDTQVQAFMRTSQSSFPDNWMCVENGDTNVFEMKVTCKNMLLNYKTANQEEFGEAVIFVDGIEVMTVNGYAEGGWNNSNVVKLIDETESMLHSITVQMKEPDKKFTLLAFGYTE